MEIIKTSIEGLLILQPIVYEDKRGYFMEAYKNDVIIEHWPSIRFIQDNESYSSYGVLRGLHIQKPPFEQTKLVRVVHGRVLDVAVDLRERSPTFGKWESVILSSENKKQFLIPKGFAHGFVVLSENAILIYKVDNPYHPESDSGILYNDEDLNIDWIIKKKDILISDKDRNLPKFKDFENFKVQ